MVLRRQSGAGCCDDEQDIMAVSNSVLSVHTETETDVVVLDSWLVSSSQLGGARTRYSK